MRGGLSPPSAGSDQGLRRGGGSEEEGGGAVAGATSTQRLSCSGWYVSSTRVKPSFSEPCDRLVIVADEEGDVGEGLGSKDARLPERVLREQAPHEPLRALAPPQSIVARGEQHRPLTYMFYS